MATQENTIGRYDMTTPAPIFYESVLKPRAYQIDGKDKGEPKYGLTVLLPHNHPDLPAMKTVAAKVAKAKWPNRQLKDLSFPFVLGQKVEDAAKRSAERKGKKFTEMPFLRDKVTVKAKSKYQPALAVISGKQCVDLDSEELQAAHGKKFYNGVECLVQLNFVAYEGKDGDGVTCYLNQVLSTGKGEKLGSSGQRSASSTFSGYVGSYSAEDPTGGDAGVDDEIPF